MSFRIPVSFVFVAIAGLSPAGAVGQTEGAKIRAVTRVWTPPLTSDGHPDLQGNWVNRLATPLERPEQLKGRQFLTDTEVSQLKRRADRIFQIGAGADAPAGDDVFLAALENREQYRRGAATGTADNMLEREFDNRTSLIVDPTDGRIPPYTPEGLRRLAVAAAAVTGGIGVSESMSDPGSSATTAGRSWSIATTNTDTAFIAGTNGRSWS